MSKKKDTLKKFGIPFKEGDDPRRKLKPAEGKKFSRKTYKVHIEMLEQAGYTPPTKDTFSRMIGLIMALQEEDLKSFADNKYAPMWIRYIAIDIQDPKKRTDLMNNYRDWMFGKAAVTQNLNISGEKNIFESINLDVLDIEDAEVVPTPEAPSQLSDPAAIRELPPDRRREIVESEVEKVIGYSLADGPDPVKPKVKHRPVPKKRIRDKKPAKTEKPQEEMSKEEFNQYLDELMEV